MNNVFKTLKKKDRFSQHSNFFQRNLNAGFTLVELVIVIALIFLIASISLFNYEGFGREIELENAAYEIALSVRTAQFAGINRDETFETGGDGGFDEPNAFGVVFDISNSPFTGLSSASFMMYVDSLTKNRQFDSAGSGGFCVATNATECIDIFTLNRGNYIKEICVGDDEASCSLTDRVHVSFKRPNPDATIKLQNGTTHSYVRITIAAPVAGIADKNITVGAAGQISIN